MDQVVDLSIIIIIIIISSHRIRHWRHNHVLWGPILQLIKTPEPALFGLLATTHFYSNFPIFSGYRFETRVVDALHTVYQVVWGEVPPQASSLSPETLQPCLHHVCSICLCITTRSQEAPSTCDERLTCQVCEF